jgi:hypothetical protein
MFKRDFSYLAIACVFATVAFATPSQAAPVGAVCTGGKLGATGKKAFAKLNCHQKAAKKGEVTDPVCLTRAETKFDNAFAKYESKPPCVAIGDGPAIEAKVDAFVTATVADLRPAVTLSKCASGQLKAAAKKSKSKLTCHQKAAKKGILVELDCLIRAEDAFDDRFAASVAEGDCLSASTAAMIEAAVDAFVNDVADDLRPGPLSVCTGRKLKDTADKELAKLKCHVVAVKAGTTVDSACLTEAETEFDANFALDETIPDCLMPTGDAAAIEALVDTFVSDVETALRPSMTASSCSSKKFAETAKESHKKLNCRGNSVRFGLPASTTNCLNPADVNFVAAEKPGDCLTLMDAAAINALIDAFVADVYADLVGPPGPTTTTTTTTTTTVTTTTTTTTVPPSFPPCVGSGAPMCDGYCTLPLEACIDLGSGCVCVPGSPIPCGTGPGAPLCLGDCPPLMACIDVAGTCTCVP